MSSPWKRAAMQFSDAKLRAAASTAGKSNKVIRLQCRQYENSRQLKDNNFLVILKPILH